MKKIIICFSILLLIVISDPVSAQKTREYTVLQIVEQVLESSFLIRESEEKRLASQMGVKSARLNFYPKLTAEYSFTALDQTPYRVYQDSFMVATGIPAFNAETASNTIATWNVSLIQPLFTGFALTTKYRIASIDAKIKDQEKRQTLFDVKKEAETACYNLLLAKKMLAVTQDAKKSYEAHVRDAQLFYNQGLIPYNDLLKFQVAQASATQDMEQAKAGVATAEARINLLLHKDMDSPVKIRDIDGEQTFKIQPIDTYISSAMTNRPVLAIVNLGIQNLSQAIKLTKSTYYPTVAVIGRYEQKGEDFLTRENNFDNRFNSSITLNATWTFFEWGKTKSDTSLLRHKRKAFIERLKEIKNNVTLEIKLNHENLIVSQKNITTARKALKQAKESLRITQLQYKQQVASSTDLLEARAFLTGADTNYYRAVYGYMITLASLNRAAGN